MIYRVFKDKKICMLGFGAMRLPLNEDGSINEQLTEQMVDYSMSHGINYYDTAYPYHGGMSEVVLGKILKKYPRESFYLADKYPGHQLSDTYNPAEIFEEQLKKCGVEYFDFYLLHNVYENSIQTYMDPQWKILDYFREQKRLGRIKHLGFSTHGSVSVMEEFLDYCGDDMEFCQIQLNYLDWTLQDAKKKCELLEERNIPVWVMEPVRGGKLANLPESTGKKLKIMRPDESAAAWAFRFLQELPYVTVVLSGMSNMEQTIENIDTFAFHAPLTHAENITLMDVAEGLKDSVPCTSCRYCTDGCPMGLDIPLMLSVYNELKITPAFTVSMRLEGLPEDKQPSACIKCGKCTHICPQSIDIPAELGKLAEMLEKLPKWADICRERAEAAKKNK